MKALPFVPEWVARLLSCTELLLAEADKLKLTEKQRAGMVSGCMKARERLRKEAARTEREPTK